MGAVEYEVAGGDGENEKYMMNFSAQACSFVECDLSV